MGDGLLALFDEPAPAIRCGRAIGMRLAEPGVRVRVGLHFGDVEWLDGAVRGIAVHLSARIAAVAQPREVLVSATTRDLVPGSDLAFADRGAPELEGIAEPRDLRALAGLAPRHLGLTDLPAHSRHETGPGEPLSHGAAPCGP